jgi:parallel beta-helix repeat protein
LRVSSFHGALLSTFVIASIGALAVLLVCLSPAHAALNSHASIYINGNDNFITGNGVVGGSGTENDPYIIENWHINASSANGVKITNTTTYFVIRNCLVDNGKNYYGIYLDNVVNGKVENCKIENNVMGVLLLYSNNNTILGNNIENNHPGIALRYSGFNTISGNTIRYNSSGIDLGQGSNNNIISNNIAENNEYDGIVFYYAENNLISSNILQNNSNGIFLSWYTRFNLISSNILQNNSNGIDIYHTSWYHTEYNLIYHNNFVNNGTQACNYGTNYWDNGYPSGGNYWSDYTGTDYRRGENQNVSGSDGIWDNSYYIPDGSSLDRYPTRMLSSVAGWNLLGFSIENTPNNIFVGLNYWDNYVVFRFHPPGGPYEYQDPDEVFNDNTGYWVWIDQDKTVITSSARPISENTHLVTGWNLLSFPVVEENTTPNNVFSGLNYWDNYVVFRFHPPGGPYEYQAPDEVLSDNMGYWVWIDQDWTVTVP